MAWLNDLAQNWWPLFALHMVEVSLFVLLIAGVERLLNLNVAMRYTLWLLALVKIFIPPFLTLPAALPENISTAFLLPDLVTTGATLVRDAAFNLHSLLFGVWLASAALVFGLMVKRHLSLRQRLQAATPIAPLLAHCEAFEASAITSPVLTGLLRTRLYLPQDWRTWPQQQLQSVLQHEAAHLRSRDLWTLGLENVALVLFGLNPLVWLVRRRLTYLRELRCDLAAISESGMSALDYSKLLYAFAQRQTRPAPAMMANGIAFAAQHSTLYQRLQHLLTRKEPEMKTRKFTRVLLLGLLGVAMLMFSWQCSEPPLQSHDVAVSSENGNSTVTAQEFDQPPNLEFFQNPIYPENAQRAGIGAEVHLRLTIDAEGKVVNAAPLKVTLTKSGLPVAEATEAQPQEVDNVSSAVFIESANAAARDFKFKPALLKGRAVPSEVTLPIRFKLDQSAGALVPVVNVELC